MFSYSCPAGSFCDLKRCVQICNDDVPCADGLVCTPRGRCSADGTDPGDPPPVTSAGILTTPAPLLTVGVAVDLPETASSPLPGQDEPLAVTVGRDGKVYLQDSEITVAQLGPRLQAITQRNAEARIFVRGDQAVNYGQVMAVMGAIHSAGFTKVALLTQTPDETGPLAGGDT